MNQSVTQHALPVNNKTISSSAFGNIDQYLENLRLNLPSSNTISSNKDVSQSAYRVAANPTVQNQSPNVFFTSKSTMPLSSTSSTMQSGNLSNPLKESDILSANFNRKNTAGAFKNNSDMYTIPIYSGGANPNMYSSPISHDPFKPDLKQSSIHIPEKMEVTGSSEDFYARKKLSYLEGIIKVSSDFDNSKNLIDLKRFIKNVSMLLRKKI